uniref:Uncharacterized protein n=1 Tax=Pectobacterium carotovorum TaxID=554 RepID=A0A0N9NN13_PECCA|nr:Hypothetical protein [Pectobacterium carotovorum]
MVSRPQKETIQSPNHPANTLSDNINGVMQAFEDFSYQRHNQATSQKNNKLLDTALMRQKRRS